MASTEALMARTSELSRSTIELMSQTRVPHTPENYAVWYSYLEGENKELSAEINEMMENGVAFSDEANKQLYEKYVGKKGEWDDLQQVHTQTQRILKGILDEILSTGDLASDYGQKLEVYSSRLTEARHVSEMQSIIQNMIKDTTRMSQQSRQLKQRLDESTNQAEQLRQQLRKTQREALVDPLTGLHNRRALDLRLAEFHEDFRSKSKPFCAVMLDIDHFKSFNDKYGHKVGDAVLQVVTSVLSECLTVGDFPARYGGEEFVVLLRDASVEKAMAVAEDIRKKVSEKRFKLARTGQTIGQITVSLGVAAIRSGDSAETLVDRADQALYLAKNSGRNNVKTERDLLRPPGKQGAA